MQNEKSYYTAGECKCHVFFMPLFMLLASLVKERKTIIQSSLNWMQFHCNM